MERQKGQAGSRAGFVLTLLITLFTMAGAVFTWQFASAEELLLKENARTVYAGDCIELTECFSQEVQAEEVTFELAEAGGACVTVTEEGVVKAVEAGQAQVNVSYRLPDNPVAHQETYTVTVLAPQKLTGVYGEVISSLEAWKYYQPQDYEMVFSQDSLVQREEAVCVQGLEDAVVSLRRREGEQEAFPVAEVAVVKPSLAAEKFARAQGTEAFCPEIVNFLLTQPGKVYQSDILDSGSVQWVIEEKSEAEEGADAGGSAESGNDPAAGDKEENPIAQVSEKGILALREGSVRVSAVLTAKNGDQYTLAGELTVTDPALKQAQIVLAKGTTRAVELLGTCPVSTYSWSKTELEAQNDKAYFTVDLDIYGAAKGTEDVSLIVDGRVLTVHVIVTNPKFTSSSEIMYKKQSKTVKLKGLNSQYSTVAFSSSNKKIATVSKAGKVKAKKSGRVRIYAQVDGKKIYVLVEISSKAGYKAAKKAIAISKTKTKYSQWRRMSKGYYDCSSLVSRVYRPYKVYFGVKRGWSPTAAAIGKWCARNKKVLAKKAVSYKKLLPGDIICYSYTRNGRYRNISHIEIYVGNGKNVSASSSYNKVVHYAYKNGSTVLVARPKK